MEKQNKSSSGYLDPSSLANWGSENFNQAMDFNNNPVPLNQIPDFLSIPPYMVPQYRQADQEKEAVQLFWQQQIFEIQNAEAIKGQQQLPLARIKRIMKADKEVQMINTETPLVLAKACEIFIQELSLRAWMRTEQNKRRTIHRCDIAKAINQTDVLDFLADVVPLDHPHHSAIAHHHHNKEKDTEKFEGTVRVTQPYTAPVMKYPMMNMDTDESASSQHFSQPMQPPFEPSSQFPYNFHPN